MRVAVTVAASAAGTRLDRFLHAWLPAAAGQPLSNAIIRRLIMAGAVRVAEAVCRRPGMLVSAGMRLAVDVDTTRLPAKTRRPTAPAFEPRRVLFSDAWLLAVDKPPGLPTVPTADPGRPSLVSLVRRHLAARDCDHAPYLGVFQRLDRDTSGVVLFATHHEADAGLAKAFASRLARKTYLAITARPERLPPGRWRTEGTYQRSGSGPRSRMEPAAEGERSATAFELIEVMPHALLVRALPLTGRTHQIRVHLAERGCPILGDDRYGLPVPRRATRVPSGARTPARRSRRTAVPRLMLHAAALELSHPVTGAALAIESPLPSDFRTTLAHQRART